MTPTQAQQIPRPAAEWTEDMGSVLWWHWKWFDGSNCWGWANEAPFVGSPLTCGYLVEAKTTTQLSGQSKFNENQGYSPPTITHIYVGGWPGYHTHFTPLSLPLAPLETK